MRRLLLLAVCVTALLVTGCTTPTAPKAQPSPTPSPTPSSAPPEQPSPPPVAGSCHRLTMKSAARPTDSAPAVPCSAKHTSVTIKVGEINALNDGHLLAVDSSQVQDERSHTCPRKAPSYLGGSRSDQRLSRFRVVWFGPSVHQADLGASWFRCDIVALDGGGLAELPKKVKGVLADPGALDTFGTCGTTAPDSKKFQAILCAHKHSWRAVDIIGLPQHARYLGGPADAAANDQCKTIAQDRAHGALQYSWSFQWPTADQWKDGRRFGFCWVPTH
jgi:hypothetical protein